MLFTPEKFNTSEEKDYSLPKETVLKGAETTYAKMKLKDKEFADDYIRKQWKDAVESGKLSEKEKEWGQNLLTQLLDTPYEIFYPEKQLHGRRMVYPIPKKSKEFNKFVKKLNDFDQIEIQTMNEKEIDKKIEKLKKSREKILSNAINKDSKVAEDYDIEELEKFKNNIIVFSDAAKTKED
jgi:hypothetical protein